MTTNTKQFMSVFALSAAALFLGGCKPPNNVDPSISAGNDADSSTPPTSAGVAADTDDEPVASADDLVKCFGINTCKGESVCAVNKPELGIEHACAGENDCKGKGWIKVTRSECDTQSGEVLGVL